MNDCVRGWLVKVTHLTLQFCFLRKVLENKLKMAGITLLRINDTYPLPFQPSTSTPTRVTDSLIFYFTICTFSKSWNFISHKDYIRVEVVSFHFTLCSSRIPCVLQFFFFNPFFLLYYLKFLIFLFQIRNPLYKIYINFFLVKDDFKGSG